ncbi:putative autophagy protein [Achaetomium macrosporum]|uniref:Autophagy-related protein 13 n=1 Tax=Achaetomium macrosporum TaxID=79813 RepID=A0AAN7CAI7_9PEZI|nr:putative autophagy protein [Achaetomium macrosporum]
MHQQSRHPPRVYSPASSPQTNPARTNNPRDRVRAGFETTSQDGGSVRSESVGPGPSRESIKKLDQIIQNFYNKAAVLILQSRLNTTPVGVKRPDGKKPNQWFSIETDDIEDFRDELRVYKLSGSFENRPPPMIIETYIDASRLTSSQSLVIVDDNGKRWDVMEALNSSETSDDSPRKRRAQTRNTEVILERWRVELKCLPDVEREEFGPVLPTVYKRAIIFFRSLFVTTRIMPCWKYSQQALAKGIHPALEVKCRILTADPEYTTYDPLRQPLHDRKDVVTEYVFTDLEVPVGRFYASVTYRNDCNFRVDDAESLLSSRFMGIDENYFRPSIPQRRDHGMPDPYAEPGSLPSQRQGRGRQEPQQTYGSLSTFHGEGAPGTSPITALRSVRPIGSDTSSPSASASGSIEPPDPPHSLPIRGAAARPPLRAFEASSRRPSLSFQPFKAGSLSGSPRIPDTEAPSSPQSLTRPGLAGPSRAGNRSSLTMGMAASLRSPSAPQEVLSVTGSPRPTGRYSSSFTHRRGRPSFGGQSKGDDDQASSGKQSLSSSAQPGSGLLAEGGAIASSGSFATDDDNISEFLKALDNRKTLKSFEPNKKGESLASKRTAAQLSRFQLMRESNNALTESMTSSIHLQRSSSSSSRQLANVPSMVNPTSVSVASSSPGKPLSPHTPHTPAIPSRLSENSVIDYQAQDRASVGGPRQTIGEEEEAPLEGEDDDDQTPMTTQQAGGTTAAATTTTGAANTTSTTTSTGATAAIDIPLSPRLLQHHSSANRRANSVAHPQHHRSIAGDLVGDSYHQRSASVEDASGSGNTGNNREMPTLSTLLAYRHGSHPHQQGGGVEGTEDPASTAAVEGAEANAGAEPGDSGSSRPGGGGGPRSTGSFTSSFTRGSGTRYHHRPVPAAAARGARAGSFSSLGTGRGYAGSVEGADEEPLLFAMSELERDSRRSLEEGQGSAASGDKYEPPRGILRKGW